MTRRRESALWLLVWFALSSVGLAEELTISVDGADLRGALVEAETEAKGTVFLLSGSGPTDRDGNSVGAIGKNNSLKYLSEALNKAGYHTLRVDKRGVAASASAAIKESDLRFQTYVDDACAWLHFLKERGEGEVFLLGHSEGALVATLAAQKSTWVDGLILLAGAGRPAGVVLREQLEPKLPARLYQRADEIITELESGKTVTKIPKSLTALFRSSVQPYLISWFPIDPAEELAKVTCARLIVQGTTDLQVGVEDAELLSAVLDGQDAMIIEGMNHVLKEARGPLPVQLPSYFDPSLPLHPKLMEPVAAFLDGVGDD